jgi:hypothetical protein
LKSIFNVVSIPKCVSAVTAVPKSVSAAHNTNDSEPAEIGLFAVFYSPF